MYRNIIFKFLIFYIIITSIITYIFILDFKNTIQNHLEEKTNTHFLKYKAIYNKHKDIADVIFQADINNNDILKLYKDAYTSSTLEKNIIREKLFSKITSNYEKLKSHNLKQLHFHLPNNESFLRMHRPKKFGDNLTGIRNTVMFVNENKKYFHGFEEGRIFNGFRFVYPLFWEEEHIGSAEISFSALALIESFYNTFELNANFLIKKDIVDAKVFKEEQKNYIQSPQKDFYFEKSVYDKFPPISITSKNQDYTNETIKGEPFSFYIEELNLVKTIIPLKNSITEEIIAAICICEKDSFITNTKRNLYIMLTLTFLTIATMLYLFYRQKVVNEKLKKSNKELDRKIDIEIRKSRRKDIHIQHQSKMAAVEELLNNISHQWRQPLNVITTSSSGLKIHKELGTLDDKNFELLTDSINEQSNYLSKIIESFKSYLTTENSTETRNLCVQERVDNAIDILNSTFEYYSISIKKDYFEDKLYIKAAQGQLIQSLIYILNNAKDALIKNNELGKRHIWIAIKQTNTKKIRITIEDNAGGISKDIIEKIFEPYFTTKHQSQGTGMSLYLAYETINVNLGGKLYVKNTENGAKFFIEIPNS